MMISNDGNAIISLMCGKIIMKTDNNKKGLQFIDFDYIFKLKVKIILNL